MNNTTIHYTAHYNWEWVVIEAFHYIDQLSLDISNSTAIISSKLVTNFSKLPSVIQLRSEGKTVKPSYSLFRCDCTCKSSCDSFLDACCNSSTMMIVSTRTTSDTFGFLDPKDSLYMYLSQDQAQLAPLNRCISPMPMTRLIAWDAVEKKKESDGEAADALSDIFGKTIPWLEISDHDRNHPDNSSNCFTGTVLLKAPLGSGGFGLYFVQSIRQVKEVLASHAEKARQTKGFLDSIKQNFYNSLVDSDVRNIFSVKGSVGPCWSLQEVVSSVRAILVSQSDKEAADLRRCQVRAYVVATGHGESQRYYLYSDFEIRLPYWDCDSSFDITSDDEDCCRSGGALPYNYKRNKARTERYMLGEVQLVAVTSSPGELPNTNTVPSPKVLGPINPQNAGQAVIECVSHALRLLSYQIDNHRTKQTRAEVGSAVSVVAIDLLLSHDPCYADSNQCRAHIVEMNCNPAMPKATGKHMSEQYRQHLIQFVASTILLSICDAPSDDLSGKSSAQTLLRRTCVKILSKIRNSNETGKQVDGVGANGKFILI